MDNNKLYVGNIDYNATDGDLAKHFESAGKVESAKIITNPHNGRSKGFGFVEMASGDEAKKAMETLDGKDFNGRPLNVKEARPMQPRDNR